MTNAQLYKKADHADDIADLDLMDADPKELAEVTYNAWCEATEDIKAKEHAFVYQQACKITRPYADMLMDVFKEKQLPFEVLNGEYKWAPGVFFSSICNQSSQKEIICNLEMGLNTLAYRLPEDKAFINYGKAGEDMGFMASGTVINCGRTDRWLGRSSSGIVINYGQSEFDMGQYATGTIINCGEAYGAMGWRAPGIMIAFNRRSHGGPRFVDITSGKKLVLKECDCDKLPELTEYFDDLKAVLDEGKADCKALSKLPSSRKIKEDVESILKERGYLRE